MKSNISRGEFLIYLFWKLNTKLIKLDKRLFHKSFNLAKDLTEKEIQSVCFYADNVAGYKKIINLSGAHQTFWYSFLSEIILERSWNSLMILV